MKKKILLSLILVVALLPTLARADALTLPPLKQGFGYSLIDDEFNYFATVDIIKKYGFTLGAGYAGRAEQSRDKLVSTFTYELGNLKKWVDVPIAEYVDLSVGVYAGLGNVQINHPKGGNELDWGLTCSVISIKF